VLTTIAHVVLKELLAVEGLETIASLIDLRIIGCAGLTELLDTILEEVLVELLVVSSESLLEVRISVEVELEIKNLRAGTALTDTILMPVLVETSIVMIEGLLEVRILVVIEVRIEDKILHVGTSSVGDGGEAHSGHQALRITLVLEVPEHLVRSKVGEPWVEALVGLRIIKSAGLTELLDTILEEVLVDLLVVSAESLLEVRISVEVELEIKNSRASTALTDTILMPVLVETSIVMIEGLLEVRISVVIEIRIEHNLLHVHGGIRGNTSQHHFRKGLQVIKHST